MKALCLIYDEPVYPLDEECFRQQLAIALSGLMKQLGSSYCYPHAAL